VPDDPFPGPAAFLDLGSFPGESFGSRSRPAVSTQVMVARVPAGMRSHLIVLFLDRTSGWLKEVIDISRRGSFVGVGSGLNQPKPICRLLRPHGSMV
jgi:hypothetical protein